MDSKGTVSITVAHTKMATMVKNEEDEEQKQAVIFSGYRVVLGMQKFALAAVALVCPK
jgi:hypothetical protein